MPDALGLQTTPGTINPNTGAPLTPLQQLAALAGGLVITAEKKTEEFFGPSAPTVTATSQVVKSTADVTEAAAKTLGAAASGVKTGFEWGAGILVIVAAIVLWRMAKG